MEPQQEGSARGLTRPALMSTSEDRQCPGVNFARAIAYGVNVRTPFRSWFTLHITVYKLY